MWQRTPTQLCLECSVDLELSADQVSMCDGIRALLQGRFNPERVREGFNQSVYQELNDAGVFSLIADGFCWADAAIVFEQLGTFCVPGPLVACALSGELASHVEAHNPTVVEHLGHVDSVLCIGADVRRARADSLTGVLSDWPLDPLTPVTRVSAPAFTAIVGDAAAAIEWRQRGAVLTAAYQLGIASHLADMSAEYAKSRIQFDRPIGSFQAVKHLLADMVVRVEIARASVYAAAAHLDEPTDSGLARTIAVAKTLAGEAAIANGKAATQVHGGMGYTWEVDVHLYMKRAWLLETHFGNSDSHCDAIAASL